MPVSYTHLDVYKRQALKEIKKRIHIPLVADIHFDYKMAIAAMENGADKIRILSLIHI